MSSSAACLLKHFSRSVVTTFTLFAGSLAGLGVAQAQTPIVVDDDDATGVVYTGTWTRLTTNPTEIYGASTRSDNNGGKGTKQVQFTPNLPVGGVYRVEAWWREGSTYATTVPFIVKSSEGTYNTTFHQRHNGSRWVTVTQRQFAAGSNPNSGSVTITNTGTSGPVMADAVRFTLVSGTEVIVDDNHANEVSLTGTWNIVENQEGHYSSYFLIDDDTGKGNKTATFTPSFPVTGLYDIYGWWQADSVRATNIPFDLKSLGGTQTVPVNQQQGGSQWNLLGSGQFLAGSNSANGSVTVRNAGTTAVVGADAFRWLLVRAAPPTPANFGASGGTNQVTLSWNASADADAYKLYRSTTSGATGTTTPVTVWGTSYLDSGLNGGTTYYYTLKATNTGGDSPATTQVSATPSGGSAPPLPTPTAPPATDLIVDDAMTSAQGMSYIGTWTTGTDAGKYSTSIRKDGDSGKGSKEALFTPTFPVTGLYNVYAWWPAASSRPTNVPYDVRSQSGTQTFPINQRLDNGAWTPWGLITSANFAAGSSVANGSVRIRNLGTEGGVVADAMRFVLVTSAPGAPIFSSITPGNGSITLNWNAMAGLGYRLYRSTTSGQTGSTTPIAVSGTSYTDTNNGQGLTNGTPYYYTLKAVSSGGESPASGEVTATPIQPPPAVTTLSLVSTGDGTVSLRWPAVATATSYRVRRAEGSGAFAPLLDVVTESENGNGGTINFSNTGLQNGTTYHYRVYGVNSGGNGADSNQVSGTPLALPVAVSPVALAQENTKLRVGFSTIGSTSEYRLFRRLASENYNYASPLQTLTGVSGAVSTPDNSVEVGTNYFYVVRGVNSSGLGAASTEVSAVPLAAPTGLALVAGNAQVSLSWNAVTGAAATGGYKIKRRTSPTGTVTEFTSNTNSFTDNNNGQGLQNGTTYYYSVCASNNAGDGPESTQLSAAPVEPPATPSGLVTTSGAAQVDLDWSDSARATSYEVLRSDSLAGTYSSIATGLSASAYLNNTGLTNGTTYYYKVVAKNLGGTTTSAPVAGTPMLAPAVSIVPGDSQLELKWAAVAGANSYRVTQTSSAGQVNYSPTTNSQLASGLTNGTSYSFTVRAYNDASTNLGIASTLVSATPIPKPTLSITGIGIDSNGQGSVSLSWSAITGPSASGATYTLLRSDSLGGNYTSVVSGLTALVATDNGLTKGVPSFYKVRAANPLANLSLTSEAKSATPLAASTLSATAGNASVSLSWTTVQGADTYQIYASGSPIGSPLSGLTQNLTGVQNGVTTYYTVKALNSSGVGPASNQVGAKPMAPPTTAPTLSLSTGDGSATLSWTSVSDADSYKVKRSIDGGQNYETLQPSISGTSFLQTGLQNGTTYFYRVYAVNVGGDGPDSNQVSGTPLALPTAVGAVTLAPKDARIDLSFVATNGSSYRVYRATSPGGYNYDAEPLQTLTGTGTISTPDTGLQNGTRYYYVVCALNSTGASAASAEVSAVPLAKPVAPTLGAVGQTGQVTLSWNPVEGATSYRLQRSTSAGGPYTEIASGSTLTQPYPDTAVNNGTTYYYVISASNASGEGALSLEKSARPLAAPALGLTGLGGGSATLGWSVVPGASGYQLFRATRPAGFDAEPLATIAHPTLSYLDGSAENGTTYDYQVRAIYPAAGNSQSAFSNLVSATPVAAPSSAPTLSLASTGDSLVNLSWTSVNGADHYRIKRAEGTGDFALLTDIVIGSGPTISFPDTDLENGTTYRYRVYANNIGGDGPDSNQVSGTPLALPAQVGTVTLTPGDAQIGLSFESVPTASEYRVYRASSPGGYNYAAAPHKTLTGTATITATDTGLTNDDRYYYVVRAVNTTGTGVSSAEVSAVPKAKPAKPSLRASAGDGVVNLNWDAVEGATSYVLKRGTQAGGPYELVSSSLLLLEHEDLTVENGTTYYYVLAASNDSGTGLFSDEVSATPLAPPATVPGNFQVTSYGLSVFLSWDAVNGATGYQLLRSTVAGNFTGASEVTTTGLDYQDDNVQHGVTYYQLRAFNSAGQGPAAAGQVTVYALQSYDARIAAGSGSNWLGEGIINSTGLNQTLSQNPVAGQTLSYRVAFNGSGGNGTSEYVDITVPNWAAFHTDGWTARFYDAYSGGTEVTTQVTGVGGWRVLSPGAQALPLRVEITAPANAAVGDIKSLLVRITQSGTGEVLASDTVQARAQVRASTQPDLSVRPIASAEEVEADWTGVGVLAPTEQKLSQVTVAGTMRSYELRIKNAGSAANTFTLKLPATPTGWTAKLFDSLTSTTEITSAAQGETGWTTPELATGASLSLRLEVAGTVSAAPTYQAEIEVLSDTEVDGVTVEQVQQSIVGLQWSEDNLTWQDVTSATLLQVHQLDVIGIRAKKAVPTADWPDSHAVGPDWTFQGQSYLGETVWLHADNLTSGTEELATATLGGSASIRIKITPGQGIIHFDTVP